MSATATYTRMHAVYARGAREAGITPFTVRVLIALYDVYGEGWSLAAAVAAALTVIHLSAARP